MKFGIPSGFELEVEIPSRAIQRLPEPSNREAVKASTIFDLIDNNKELVELQQINSFPQFGIFKNSVVMYCNEAYSKKVEDESKKYSALNKVFNENKSLANANIDTIVKTFEQNLNLQSLEVDRIIKQEEERKRIEADRKKKLEEERLKKLEQERKLKEEQERNRKEEELKRQQEEEGLKKLAEEKSIKEQEELKQRELQLEREKEAKRLQEENKQKAFTNFNEIEKEFLKHKQDIADIKSNIVNKLNENKELKKSVNQLKRKINPKFGQLSNSLQQLRKINEEVIELVNLAKNADDLAYKWILNFVAKAIIDQAETEVTVQPAAALPLSRLAYSLLNTFREFEYFLTARFIKKCPYIIGYTCPIDSEEGRLRMGWKRKDEKWEDEVKYDERVSGICTVWSTMTRITDYAQLSNYSFETSWKFLARLLNTNKELLTNTHFTVASNWWEACAKLFLQKFGSQSYKLLHTLSIDWTNSVTDRKFPAAARLLILGEDWLHNNKIESIKEMEP